MDSAKNISWAEVITIDVHAANYLLNQGHRYLDVRTEEEFKNGHLQNALNIPYMLIYTPEGGDSVTLKNPEFVDQVLAVCGQESHLVVGCQNGVRSENACNDLRHAEFKYVYNMGGGYAAWVANGFAVKKLQI